MLTSVLSLTVLGGLTVLSAVVCYTCLKKINVFSMTKNAIKDFSRPSVNFFRNFFSSDSNIKKETRKKVEADLTIPVYRSQEENIQRLEKAQNASTARILDSLRSESQNVSTEVKSPFKDASREDSFKEKQLLIEKVQQKLTSYQITLEEVALDQQRLLVKYGLN